MTDLYRVEWEMVALKHLRLYSNADPMYYKHTTQTVPNASIPDEHWEQISRETDNPWAQYHNLRKSEASGFGFVRNVRLLRMVGEPRWEEVHAGQTSDATPSEADECSCARCDPGWGDGGVVIPTRLSVCPDCGNKRCPKGTDHDNECTGSNKPGQEGSRYA